MVVRWKKTDLIAFIIYCDIDLKQLLKEFQILLIEEGFAEGNRLIGTYMCHKLLIVIDIRFDKTLDDFLVI